MMARRICIAWLACALLVAPAIGNVSRCGRSMATGRTCCCTTASNPDADDCCRIKPGACCCRTASQGEASHPCCCRSDSPVPAIPAQEREEIRTESALAADAAWQSPPAAPPQISLLSSVDEGPGLAALGRSLLCRWLI